MPERVSSNARIGAIALILSSPLHALVSLHSETLAPLAYICWLGVSFGALCLCEELGAQKPLNRAGLVLFGAAFFGRSLMTVAVDPILYARSLLLFALALITALLFWSVALMHRNQGPRVVGILGAATTGSALALIVAAHLLLGSLTIWGFSSLFLALSNPMLSMREPLAVIDAILCLWGTVTACLLWTRNLRTTGSEVAPSAR